MFSALLLPSISERGVAGTLNPPTSTNLAGALPAFQASEATRLASTSSGVEIGVQLDPEAEEGNLDLELALDLDLDLDVDLWVCLPNDSGSWE